MESLVIAKCCREWPVSLYAAITGRMGRCGYCNERPVYTPARSLSDYMADRQKGGPHAEPLAHE